MSVWSDMPTYNQLNLIFNWFTWIMSREEARKAIAWLHETATRRDVSTEMSRLKALKNEGRLDANTCFESEIWEGYYHD